MPSLYLIPTALGESSFDKVFPKNNLILINEIKCFIVEDLRSARRFLKKINPKFDIDSCRFFTLNKTTKQTEIKNYLHPLEEGLSIGLLSEAGCPGIADPGADVIALAHQKNISVIPLVGPSSILLALMSSGFNGQSFSFLGYLPIKPDECSKMIKKIEHKIYDDDQTQIFIETPYRNMKMLELLVKTCQPYTKLCIAADLTLDTEYIKTKNIKDWKNNLPKIEKKPCVFLLFK